METTKQGGGRCLFLYISFFFFCIFATPFLHGGSDELGVGSFIELSCFPYTNMRLVSSLFLSVIAFFFLYTFSLSSFLHVRPEHDHGCQHWFFHMLKRHTFSKERCHRKAVITYTTNSSKLVVYFFFFGLLHLVLSDGRTIEKDAGSFRMA